ncbi:hypothetical protein AB0G95_36805 [Streptomyces virginiae]|uniref:hypothetical protein n=1 Tax=Streptomyces virginiae TaxID=1961 RepID=UPI003426BFE6
MSTGTAPGTIDGLCEHIRGGLAEWAPRILGVHVHQSVPGPAEVARLLDVAAAAAEVTVLPGNGATARAELHMAAALAAAAAAEGPLVDVRAELAAARAGCRRAAVALGLPVPITL